MPTITNKAEGFALVITLLMLTLVAVLAVALLTNASLDRQTTSSFNYRYEAELATQSGLEAAKKALVASPDIAAGAKPVTTSDTFLVVRADGAPKTPGGTQPAYYFLAQAQAGGNGAIDYYPLFSGGIPQNVVNGINATSYVVTAPTAPGTAFSNPAQETFGSVTRQYPQLLPNQEPAYTQWIEVKDPNDKAGAPNHNLPYQRFAYWIEDLGGYIDASVAGNTAGSGNAHARPLDQTTPEKRYQTSPAELAMFTIFNATASTDPADTGAKSLIASRGALFTVPTVRQLAPGPSNTDITSAVLASGTRADSELPLVPLGFGYKDEGDLTNTKLEINGQVASGGDAAVKSIAQKINVNLPKFGSSRRGGLAVHDYVNTIAASMIDYADVDSDATVGADYRGYDSYPLVNELYSMKWWKQTYAKNGTFWVTISMDTWIELWNPTNQSVSGKATINILENLPVQVGSYTYTFGTKSADLTNGATVATTFPAGGPPLTITMQPNEYTTYHLRSDVFEYDSGVSTALIFPPTTSPPYKLPLTASLLSNYEMSWQASGANSQIVDKAGGGIERIGGSLSGPPNYINSNKRWNGAYSGFSYANPGGVTTFDSPGDPRAAFYLGQPSASSAATAQAAVAYAQGSSFWVRNNRSNVAATTIYAAVKPTSWPDRGHDTALVVTAPPASPVAQAVADPPTTRPAAAVTESTKAPVTISNAGFYSTTAEFGNIFDPAQWNIIPDGNNRWTDITSTTAADTKYGGGISLRIGRPEFTRFDQPGVRAWQLLDLFTVGNRVNTRGLVNINTASRDALRVLGAGLKLNRDSDLQPATPLYPPFKTQQADMFADAIIAARPFLSVGQLADLPYPAGSATKFFGNSTVWPSSPPTEWNDSGTEEYFAKVFPLGSVRSRNFRVFVTGQSVDKTGKPLSTVSKAFQVYIEPTRNASGAITSQKTIVTYETQLPL